MPSNLGRVVCAAVATWVGSSSPGLTYTFDAAPAQDAAPVGGAGAGK